MELLRDRYGKTFKGRPSTVLRLVRWRIEREVYDLVGREGLSRWAVLVLGHSNLGYAEQGGFDLPGKVFEPARPGYEGRSLARIVSRARRQREDRYRRCARRVPHTGKRGLSRLVAWGRGDEQELDPFEDLLRLARGIVLNKAGVVADTLKQRLQGASGYRVSSEDRDCRW